MLRASAASGTGSGTPRSRSAGNEADERFVAQVLDDEPRVGDGFGHDRERELALGDFARRAAPTRLR